MYAGTERQSSKGTKEGLAKDFYATPLKMDYGSGIKGWGG
jgi:hypothetical protein